MQAKNAERGYVPSRPFPSDLCFPVFLPMNKTTNQWKHELGQQHAVCLHEMPTTNTATGVPFGEQCRAYSLSLFVNYNILPW